MTRPLCSVEGCRNHAVYLTGRYLPTIQRRNGKYVWVWFYCQKHEKNAFRSTMKLYRFLRNDESWLGAYPWDDMGEAYKEVER